MPNPYTKGSDLHKIWELIIVFPDDFIFYSFSDHAVIAVKLESRMMNTYRLLGMTKETIQDLVPPMTITAKLENGMMIGLMRFHVHIPNKKNYKRFKDHHRQCMKLLNSSHPSTSGIEYGNEQQPSFDG